MPPESNCCSSISRMMPSHRTSSLLILPPAPITTGMCFFPVFGPGRSMGYRVHGPFDPGRGLRFDPTKVLLDPYGRGVVMPEDYSRAAASQPGDNAATAMKSVVVDPSAYDWEGDAPLEASLRPHHHLRNACARVHAPSKFRRGNQQARHLCRPDRKDSLPSGFGHHCRGTAAGLPVRRSRLPAGENQLLGLCADLVFCASPGLQLASRSLGAGGRISRHGQSAASSRDRGHSRCRVQSYGRRRRWRADR